MCELLLRSLPSGGDIQFLKDSSGGQEIIVGWIAVGLGFLNGSGLTEELGRLCTDLPIALAIVVAAVSCW